MADLEAGEGTYEGSRVNYEELLARLHSALRSDLDTRVHYEELLAGLRSLFRSDLREELCHMKTIYVPAMETLHDSVQQTLGEVEERLHAALAGRLCATAPGQHGLAAAAGQPRGLQGAVTPGHLQGPLPPVAEQGPAVPPHRAPDLGGSLGAPGDSGGPPCLPWGALLSGAAVAEGSPPLRRPWRCSPSRAATPRSPRPMPDESGGEGSPAVDFQPPDGSPGADPRARRGSQPPDGSPGTDPMARCYTERTSHVQGSKEWRHHMTRRVTSKLAVAGTTSMLPQMSGVLSGGPGLAVQRLGSCHIRKPRAFLQKVVGSFAFEVVSFCLILANVVIVSVRIDRSAACARSGCPGGRDRTFAWADEVFLALFLVEVMLRIVAARQNYFTGDMWQWNVLDFLLAAWGVHEVSQDRCSFMYIRIVRFFRLVRLLRLTNNVLWLRDLRLMACTLLQSLVSIFWAFVLLFVVMYCFGACFTDAVSGHLAGNKYTEASEHDRHLHEDIHLILDKLYGSLPRTMCTLLLAITNGADWMTLAEPLGEVHVVYLAMFAAYVVIVLVGALNVLTSLFVERARELSRSDRDLATQAELASQEAFIVEMRRIFEEVDEGKDGMITWEKFRDYLKNEQAQAFFTTQALDTSDAAGLFNLLDKDGKGKIKVEDFALGCMRLRGQAKSSEVATLMRESRKASRKLMTEIRGLKDQLELTQPSEAEQPASHRGPARWMASRTLSRAEGGPRAAAVGAQRDRSPTRWT